MFLVKLITHETGCFSFALEIAGLMYNHLLGCVTHAALSGEHPSLIVFYNGGEYDLNIKVNGFLLAVLVCHSKMFDV